MYLEIDINHLQYSYSFNPIEPKKNSISDTSAFTDRFPNHFLREGRF